MKNDDKRSQTESNLKQRVESMLRTLDKNPAEMDIGEVRCLLDDLYMENVEVNLQCELLRGAHEELEETRSKYVHLYEFSPVGYFTLDEHGMIIEVNLTGSEMLGIDRQYLINYPFSIYIAPQSLDDFRQFRKNIIEFKRRQVCELKMQKHDGKTFEAYLESIPVEDTHGRFTQYRTTIQDISEKKQMEEERKDLDERLIQTKKLESIGKLAGGIAHELNNILTGILGWAELLLMRDVSADPAERETADHIVKLVDRAADMVQKLLGFAGGGKYEPVRLNVNVSIDESLKLTGMEFINEITINRQFENDLFLIEADSIQIEQALSNIFINAKDAMPQGGMLTVTTQNIYLDGETVRQFPRLHEGYYIRMDIADTGDGMSEEVLMQIFDPFYTTRTRKKGLGLATVYGIVKNHDGYIECNSVKGKGSVFSVYLPALEAEAENLHHSVENGFEEFPVIPDGFLLIVDDDEHLRNSMSRTLAIKNIKTIFAADGHEGIRIFSERRDEISLVLLDMLMPNISGKETFFELKKIDPAVRILLMSGYTESADVRDALQAGALGFLQKPFNLNTLVKKISSAVRK